MKTLFLFFRFIEFLFLCIFGFGIMIMIQSIFNFSNWENILIGSSVQFVLVRVYYSIVN